MLRGRFPMRSNSNFLSQEMAHQSLQAFQEANEFIGSWKTPKDPKEAEAKLAQLRRDYAKQVKNLRKHYIQEVDLMRLENQQKDEARREALRVANEVRKKLKDAAAKALRQTILKERAGKLEHWWMKEKSSEEKNELLRRKSSLRINESEPEKKISEVIIDTKSL